MSYNDCEQRKIAPELGEYLTFFICKVEYAVSLEHVREVIPYDAVTRIPGVPDTVRGATNLRGRVVPVIDLAIKFNLPQIEITPRTCIVLVERPFAGDVMLLGLLTEQVGQVLSIDRNDLLAPPSFGTPVHANYLEGMLPMGKKFALVLDIARVLSQGELFASQGVPAEPDAPAARTTEEPAVAVDDEGWDDAAPSSPAPATPAARVED